MLKQGQFVKATASGMHGHMNCVEVGLAGDQVAVRNSRRPDVEPMVFTKAEWLAFLDGAGNGEFDLPDGI
jgi:Domain of unknown function (DUF397)